MIVGALALGLLVAQQYRLPLELGGPSRAPYVTAYRDLSGRGNGLQDWSCGADTYDGHGGTDIGIGGFAVMDAGSRWVVAAADGEVTQVVDGCFDRCTTADCDCGGGFGNYARVTHGDGKLTYYGHLMDGSLQVQRGQRVTCGQRLGRVGSSGNSTGPHLHFEPRYSNGNSDDPFAGPCGGSTSFWVEQGAYQALPAERCEGGAMPPPPADGHVRGAVYDQSVTAGPADPGNRRLPGAIVRVVGGASLTAQGANAAFDFALAPGTYTVEASLDGYVTASKVATVLAGQDTWSSIGLRPAQADAGFSAPDAVEHADAAGADASGQDAVDGGAPADADEPIVEAKIAPSEGDGCSAAGSASGLVLLLVVAAMRRTRST